MSATHASVVYCVRSTPVVASSRRHVLGLGHGVQIERRFDVVVGLECLAGEWRRTPGAALVDQDDVACPADFVETRGQRRELARRLPGPSREDDQRVGLRRHRVGRQDRDEDVDPAPVRAVPVFRHGEFATLGRDRELRQAALGQRQRARRRILAPFRSPSTVFGSASNALVAIASGTLIGFDIAEDAIGAATRRVPRRRR